MTTIFQTFEHLANVQVSWLKMVIFWPRLTMAKFQGVMVMVSDSVFHKTLVLPCYVGKEHRTNCERLHFLQDASRFTLH